jgi:hypothetical protein
MNWKSTIGISIGTCLTLFLIGGIAFDASAQQPSAPAPAAPATPGEPRPQAPDSGGSQPAQSQPPQPQAPQLQQAPPANTQNDTRTEKSERVVEREPGTLLGVDPTIAVILGASLLIVIGFAVVAMSRRRDQAPHTHTRA